MLARTSAIALLALASGLAYAGSTSYQTVPVLEVEPRYSTTRTPVERTVCWEETSYRREGGSSGSSATSTIAGAIIGGVIGNQFGGGSGNRAMTAAGAALGGSVGRDAARASRDRDARYRPVREERCTIQRDYEERRVTTGYRVLYEFDGRIQETIMREHPGDTIRLRVSATPVP